MKSLASASTMYQFVPSTVLTLRPLSYLEEVRDSRSLYQTDPVVASIVNRMVALSVGSLVHTYPIEPTKLEQVLYNHTKQAIESILTTVFLTYFIDGMAVVDYTFDTVMASKLDPTLGKKRYSVIRSCWVRNNDNIVLKRVPASNDVAVFVRIPQEEREMILNEGKMSDGRDYTELFKLYIQSFPDYVDLVRRGVTLIPISRKPILRNLTPFRDYPQPLLGPLIDIIKHKHQLLKLDRHIAIRAVEAIRHVKVGNDTFPVTDGDTSIDDLRTQLSQRPHDIETVFTLITNHTVEISWVYPPLDALLSWEKYREVNEMILVGFGVSRALLTGESSRSHATTTSSNMGPISAVYHARADVIRWVQHVYEDVAERNGLRTVPRVSFAPLISADVTSFVQLLATLARENIVSPTYIKQQLGLDTVHDRGEGDLPPVQVREDVGVPVGQPDPSDTITETVTDTDPANAFDSVAGVYTSSEEDYYTAYHRKTHDVDRGGNV